jgi:hypothetical protein
MYFVKDVEVILDDLLISCAMLEGVRVGYNRSHTLLDLAP